MAKLPESHYDPNKLNFYFAIAALVLLGSLGAIYMKDYSREWKKYQAEFRELEVEKARVKYDAASNSLAKNDDYIKLQDELKKAKSDYQTNCGKLANIQNEITRLTTQDTLVSQQYKYAKAKLDALQYKLEEEGEKKSSELPKTQKEFSSLKNEVTELQLKSENIALQIKDKSKIVNDCAQQVKDLEKKQKTFETQTTILQRKLKKIDPLERGLLNQFADTVRNLPLIDMSNPSFKVEQIVLKDITEDVNFMQVAKVDRCTTCHLGIANPDYKNAAQPYRTHPNLEQYLGKDSPHPLEDFGCTVCHGGRGRGTSFNESVHTPSSPKQEEEWKKKYGWEHFHHWENPMLPLQNVEAGCFKCHSGETTLKGAEKLNLGLQLIEKSGCYGCHTIEKYKNWPKSGPDLTQLSSKLSKDWAYRWIYDPKSFRHNTWMPSYFNQSNNREQAQRSQQEVLSIVEYLFSSSQEFKLNDQKLSGDPKNGEKLVASLGCFACHSINKETIDKPITNDSLLTEHGPNLIGLGSKTSKVWIYNWLKDPSRYHPETRMPNFRLSDQEASDIAEFLHQDKNEGFDKLNVPAVDENILNTIALDFLKKIEPTKVANNKLSQMSTNDKLKFVGEKLIGHYGCYSCHNIKGFESRKPIGTDLTEEGSKATNKFDFGFVDIEHTKQAWFKKKLQDPRIFDKGRVRAHLDKLIMPNFNFNDQKAEAITTALLGFVNDKTVVNKIRPRTPENLAIEKGQSLIRQLNCQGCHVIEGQGGAIRDSVKEFLMKYDNRQEAEATAMINSFGPPNLIGEGKKVQTEWLFEFLHSPTPIRPWLSVRMPTYSFNAAHLNVIIEYFNRLDKENYPFVDKVDYSMTQEETQAAQKLFSKEYFGCAQCHIVGDQLPAGSPDSWAPNFSLSKKRLKPEWIIKWLHNPADLLPGTKMPTYFDPSNFDASGPEDTLNGDENHQIKVLRNFLMTISDHSISTPTPPTPASKSEEKDKGGDKQAPSKAESSMPQKK